MNLYRLLLVDDEKSYCETFRDRVSKTGEDLGLSIAVNDVQNWSDADLLLRTGEYHAVVLDANCLVSSDQEVEDFGFLPVALSGIQAIERDKDRRIPFAINTGYIGERELSAMDRLLKMQSGRKFAKFGDEKGLVDYIVSEIDSAPECWMEIKYADVFEVFTAGYLSEDLKTSLLSILMQETESSKIRTNLEAIRNIQDQIYLTLNVKGLFPDGQVPIGGRGVVPSFTDKNKYLSGGWDNATRTYRSVVMQTSTINYVASAIYRISSDWGVHGPPPKPAATVKYWKEPSVYTVRCLTFGLLEQLLWFKNLMKFS